jgi:hypothetical protein
MMANDIVRYVVITSQGFVIMAGFLIDESEQMSLSADPTV